MDWIWEETGKKFFGRIFNNYTLSFVLIIVLLLLAHPCVKQIISETKKIEKIKI